MSRDFKSAYTGMIQIACVLKLSRIGFAFALDHIHLYWIALAIVTLSMPDINVFSLISVAISPKYKHHWMVACILVDL